VGVGAGVGLKTDVNPPWIVRPSTLEVRLVVDVGVGVGVGVGVTEATILPDACVSGCVIAVNPAVTPSICTSLSGTGCAANAKPATNGRAVRPARRLLMVSPAATEG